MKACAPKTEATVDGVLAYFESILDESPNADLPSTILLGRVLHRLSSSRFLVELICSDAYISCEFL